MTDFVQIHYLKISVNNNMYTHTSLPISSIIMPGWIGATKINLELGTYVETTWIFW